MNRLYVTMPYAHIIRPSYQLVCQQVPDCSELAANHLFRSIRKSTPRIGKTTSARRWRLSGQRRVERLRPVCSTMAPACFTKLYLPGLLHGKHFPKVKLNPDSTTLIILAAHAGSQMRQANHSMVSATEPTGNSCLFGVQRRKHRKSWNFLISLFRFGSFITANSAL